MHALTLKDGTVKQFTRMEIMGILNVTPDSFFAGSRTPDKEKALVRAAQMIEEGAALIDVGGESTRSGAAPVSSDEEAARVCPVIEEIKALHPEILVSVDTYHAKTAAAACASGADIINDISGLTFDKDMAAAAAAAGVPVVIMHTGGRPDHMQDSPSYRDVVGEVHAFLHRQIEYAKTCGIEKEKIIIDLGIGFGKNYLHNLTLLQHIDDFADLGVPQLLAVSRKSFIGTALSREDPKDRLAGTMAVTAYGVRHGIEMVRVHDVAPNLDVARMTEVLG